MWCEAPPEGHTVTERTSVQKQWIGDVIQQKFPAHIKSYKNTGIYPTLGYGRGVGEEMDSPIHPLCLGGGAYCVEP